MLEIRKIRLNELDDFVKSETFGRFQEVPVTPARVKSFLENPRAKATDVVLFLGFVKDKLVAFRSLFADELVSKGEKIRFGWCSGNWVHPDFRRNGFSELLLKEAYIEWNGKLMFTNYAGESEKLYQKTGWFSPVHQFEGVRAYLFPKTRKLIPGTSKNVFSRFIFSSIDSGIKVVSSLRLLFFSPSNNPEIRFETSEFPDESCFQFCKNKSAGFILRRGESELKWIFNYPWISTSDPSFVSKYPFSSYSNDFYYRTVKIFQKELLVEIFIFSVREGHLKTLYFLGESGKEKEITVFLKKYCGRHKIERLTVYNQRVADEIIKRKFPFLQAKKYGQKIYSTFPVEITGEAMFQDGDGDLFFT